MIQKPARCPFDPTKGPWVTIAPPPRLSMTVAVLGAPRPPAKTQWPAAWSRSLNTSMAASSSGGARPAVSSVTETRYCISDPLRWGQAPRIGAAAYPGYERAPPDSTPPGLNLALDQQTRVVYLRLLPCGAVVKNADIMPTRRVAAPRRGERYHALMAAIVARLPFGLSRIVAPSFLGFAIINGFTFSVDLGLLSLCHGVLRWPYPAAVTLSS